MSFFDGSSKSISFGQVGDNTMRGVWQGGQIVNISEPKQQTDMVTKEPKFFPKSNDPIMKVVITLDTRAGNYPAAPIDDNDDGTRDYHVAKGTGQFRALGAAIREGKHGDVAVGGFLYTRWVSGEGRTGDARQFETLYQPPAQGTGGMFTETAGQAPAATQFPSQVSAGGTPKFDPNTGQPIAPPVTQQAPAPRFDPNTGQPLAPVVEQQAPAGPRFDPNTGQPIGQAVVNPYAP